MKSSTKFVSGAICLHNAKTQAIYTYLKSVWGQKTLSGQQDLTWKDSIDMADCVFTDTGKYPAIMGYDFMNSEVAGVTHKDNFWTGEYYNTKAHKTKVYNRSNVITLDELPTF